MRSTERGGLPVFSESLPPRCKHHRRSIFCGTFRGRGAETRFRAPIGATPWRYQARCPAVADSCEFTTAGVRTFLPPAPLARSQAGDHPAPVPRVSPLHSQVAFCSQSSDIVFNIAGARKFFTGFA